MRKFAFAAQQCFDRRLRLKLAILYELKAKMELYDRIVYMDVHDDLEEKALAYKDPKKVLAEIAGYLWSVPTTPTPYVGEAPAPGCYGHNVINSQQFRNSVDVVLPKPPNVYRIFFTGGSTAFCSGAPSDDATISAYLQKQLDQQLTPLTGINYEVINAACPGWASTYERLWIELKLAEMEPDMVITFSGNNDAHWGARNFSVGWMRGYGEQLYWKMVSSWYAYLENRRIYDSAPREKVKVSPDKVAQTLNKNVRCCLRLLTDMKVPYVFILHPTISETKKPLTQREQKIKDKDKDIQYFHECYCAMRQALIKIETTTNLPIDQEMAKLYDYSDVFDGYGANDEIFLDSYHFGDRGNEIIAQKIFKDLIGILMKKSPKTANYRGITQPF